MSAGGQVSLVDVARCEGAAGSVDSVMEAEVGLDTASLALELGGAGVHSKR